MTVASWWTPLRFLLDLHVELGPVPTDEVTEPHDSALDSTVERRDDDGPAFGFTRSDR